ncbi:hypothetical protein [Actinacidiphila glaucinigra]|uniref:Scaffolding protein n=1 Tax=Actinacidiphila glaucinigra TaxID=235986 RepID=A0A239F031_9ACTN|nr:hypothetical protein [Actinacidiphila glaucinigra]SNS50276.1 hypothetical protein SAMN05216252_106244 [Actinacidiphila glaucinigra]
MSDEKPNEENPTGETPPGPKPDDEQKPDDKAGAGGESGQSEDELPDWARKELVKVRGEAAGYRTRLRDAETKLSAAKSPEEFESALAEVKTENARLERSLLVTKVASKYELPDLLSESLKGETAEELETHAKALQALLTPTAPESLGGGLNPSDEDDGEMDPRKLARRSRRF